MLMKILMILDGEFPPDLRVENEYPHLLRRGMRFTLPAQQEKISLKRIVLERHLSTERK
jgi:hypothetical protein